jgi:hypothetical protein
MFCLRKKGSQGGSKIAGGVYLTLRDGMKQEYLSCPWNTSLRDWYNKWFYIREEPDNTTLCDIEYIPDKRVAWNERPELTGQVEELMALLPWNCLDGPAVAGSFISRRVQPCQRRVHTGYEYQGSAHQTRMRSKDLDHDEVILRIGELFNLADQSYSPPSRIQHAYKLIRPAPKVNEQTL